MELCILEEDFVREDGTIEVKLIEYTIGKVDNPYLSTLYDKLVEEDGGITEFVQRYGKLTWKSRHTVKDEMNKGTIDTYFYTYILSGENTTNYLIMKGLKESTSNRVTMLDWRDTKFVKMDSL